MIKKKALLPSQYSYEGYSPDMDNLGLLPGVTPQIPEKDKSFNWLVPLGLAAGGLTGYSLLRGAGKSIKGLLGKLRSARVPREPWNWEMEMLGRGGQKRYRSFVNPEQNIGYGYGPGPEAIVKQSSDASFIITQLANIAKYK